jgi:hypothetical protein
MGLPAALAFFVTLAPGLGVSAQSPSPTPSPSCALVSAAEANATFDAGFVLQPHSRGYYCSFVGRFVLTVNLMLETTLDEVRADFGEGVDVRAAGRPAWWQESSGNLAVALDGSVLFLNGFDGTNATGNQLAALSSLAALMVPRIPPPADAAVVARLKGAIPARIDGVDVTAGVLPGWYLLAGADPGDPATQVLLQALGEGGASASDLVVVFATAGSDVALVAAADGVTGAELLLPLLYALVPTVEGREASDAEIAGRAVTRIETEPPTYAAASDDLAVIVNGSDAFAAALFGGLP